MLGKILALLDERGALSVREIALALGIDPGALRPMLDLLERKGRVERLEPPCRKSCSACSCDSDAMTFFRGTGKKV